MIRISIGIGSLIVGVLFAAELLGLIPDRDGAVIAGRKSLCESVDVVTVDGYAVHCWPPGWVVLSTCP